VLQAVLGGLATSYLRGAMLGFGATQAAFNKANLPTPDFNNLYVKMLSDTKAGVELQDLKALEAALKEVAPSMFRKFKNGATKIGRPAANEMRKTFRSIDPKGPLAGRRKKDAARVRQYDSMYSSQVSRISWYQTAFATGRKGIDVNYKNRKASYDFSRLADGRDGTVGIVRIAVKSPAYIIADITGRGNRRRGTGELSRSYQINLFGRGVIVTRQHRVNKDNVDGWIRALNTGDKVMGGGRPSRYAYPTLEKHSGKFAENLTDLLNQTIIETNRKLNG
jgi:hypothetical protein